MRPSWSLGGLACAVLILAGSYAQAQGSAELRGVVVDQAGAALVGVTVTATNTETGAARSLQTSAGGSFMMPALPLGVYEVKAELTGFATVVETGLRLGVGDTISRRITMQVAAIQETVTVSAEAPLVDTTTSSLSGRIEPDQMANLPLNTRNWLDLVALVPGARGNPGAVVVGSAGGDAANYQMDGLQVNGQGTGVERQEFSHEAIGEFEVLTNRFDAEYGRALGAVVNAVTKTGTNRYHGSAYGFLRKDFWDAANPLFGDEVPPTDIWQAGGTLGGPIVRDKAHFFGNYERQVWRLTERPTTGYPQFDVPVEQPTTYDYATARVDFTPSSDHRLFARASLHKWNFENIFIGGSTAFSAGADWPATLVDFVVGDTWVASSRAVHELRVGRWSEDKSINEKSPAPQLVFPSVTLGGPFANVPQWWKENTWQAKYTLFYFLPDAGGDHRFKFGVSYLRAFYEGELPERAYGQFFFDADPAAPNDPSTYPPPTFFSTQLGEFYYRQVNPIYSGFLQDDWSVTSRLTLNLGVRYDVEPDILKDAESPLEPGDRAADWNNVAPRFGFAYDVLGNGRTVLRGGAGIYFGNILLDLIQQEARTQNKITVTVVDPDFEDPLGGLTYDDFIERGIPRDLWVVANDYKAPRNEQMSIGIAQQIGSRYAVQVDYVRTRSRDLPLRLRTNYFEDPVTHLPLNPRIHGRPFPQWVNVNFQDSAGRAQYDGVQMGIAGRRGSGFFDFQGSYTLSWTKGHADPNRYGFINNAFNIDDDYAELGRDQRHRVALNGSLYLPWGTRLSTIFFAGSPYPINVGTRLDPFQLGYTGRWLDAAGNVVPKNSERGTRWDVKLDVRVQKNVKIGGAEAQALLDVFNVLNRTNYGLYGATVGSRTYLQPLYSSGLFYQKRQFQLGLRLAF